MRKRTIRISLSCLAAALLACNSGQVDAPVTGGEPECTTNRECLDRDPSSTSICSRTDLRCIPLTTNDCPKLLGDREALASDDVVVIGAITGARASELGDATEAAIGLAQSEIAASGRPVVVLSCQEFSPNGYAGLLRAANHLVKDVGVPLILGPSEASSTDKILREVTLPSQTLVLSTTTASKVFADLPGPPPRTPLVWRLNWSDAEAVQVVQKFIDDALVPKLKQDGLLGPTEPLRVAILAEDERYGGVFRDQLTWNRTALGTPAHCAENAALDPPACSYLEFGSLADVEGNPSPEGSIAKAVGQIFYNGGSRKQPHLIVHAYSQFGIPRVLFPIEAGWDSSDDAKGNPRPYHVGAFPELNSSQSLYASFIPFQEAQSHVGPAPYKPLSQRVFGVVPHPERNIAGLDDYVAAFKRAYPDFTNSSTPRDIVPRQFYDAVYMAAYAIAANGDRPTTGENLAETLPRLVGGEPVNVGPQDRARALQVLHDGGSVELAGVSGGLDLDPTTGAARYSMEMSCVGVPVGTPPATLGQEVGHGGPYDQFVSSGFWYDERTGARIGSLPGACPTLTQSVPADVWPAP